MNEAEKVVVPPAVARARLEHVRLGMADLAVVNVLLDALGEQPEQTVKHIQEALFGGRTAAAATKALERLIKLVNSAAEESGVDLRLVVRGATKLGATGRMLGFWADHVEPAGAPLREHEQVRRTLIANQHATLLEPRRLVFCHHEEDGEQAGRLWDAVDQALGSDQTRFTVWRADQEIVAGDDPYEELRKALVVGELVVVALTDACLAERRFVELISAARLPVVPVALRALSPHADLPGFATTVFRSTRPFVALRGDVARDRWVHDLIGQVHRQLDRSSARLGSVRQAGSYLIMLRDLHALRSEERDGVLSLEGKPHSMRLEPLDTVFDLQRVDAVSYLLDWARKPGGTPLAALLGEYGTGKTITCQELTERLRAGQDGHDEDGVRLEPLYFDLRALVNLGEHVPRLEEILTECIQRGWASPEGVPLPSGAEVIARAKTKPTLFVIDGLDEVLVRLDAAKGVAFTHELLKLRPVRGEAAKSAQFAGESNKVLISCRTHYFRSLREQTRHFLEQDRDKSAAEDYTALVLLPLTDEQIRDYLSKALPDRDATQIFEMLKAVHDLSDLATRPYTLSKVAAQVPFIEQRHAERRPVRAATIYRQVMHDWLERDRGKHRLRPNHKLTLMARLAAWSWRQGGRRLDSAALDDWLTDQLATDPTLHARYATMSREQLEEDLRTATFVVRNDDGGPDKPGFQFAHSSIHEYFLAHYLHEALAADRRDDWCLPLPSTETFEFLGQLIADNDDPGELVAQLGRWRAPYLAGASELRLRYLLHARTHGWPHPSPAGSDLASAVLRGWNFTGTPAAPLNFARTSFAGADLRDTHWDHATLAQSELSGARLDRATLNHVNLTGGVLRGADLTAAFLRYCRLDDADLAGVTINHTRHVHSGSVLPSPPQPATVRIERLGGHQGSVYGVAFSPDGRRLASAGTDGVLAVWDAVTGERLYALAEQAADRLCGVAFCPNGRLVASAGGDGVVRVWSSVTGASVHALSGHGTTVTSVAFSPDGLELASADGDGVVRVWDCETGEVVQHFALHDRAVNGVAFSPDGRRMASAGSDERVQLWDRHSGEVFHVLRGHSGEINDLEFSVDGRLLASAGDDGTVRTWDVETGEWLNTFVEPSRASVRDVAFSPDGRQLVSACGIRVVVWDRETGEVVHSLTGHLSSVNCVAFSPDGRQLVSAGADGAVRIWDCETGEFEHASTDSPRLWLNGVVFDPTGSRVITAGDGGKGWVWKTDTGESLNTFSGRGDRVLEVAFGPAGDQVVSAGRDGTLLVSDAADGELLHTLTGHTAEVNRAALSPDGRRLVSSSRDGTVRVWDFVTGRSLGVLHGHTGGVWGVAFSPDGLWIASAGSDETARIWDSGTGDCLRVLTGHDGEVNDVSFSPDGSRLVSCGDDATVRLWDCVTGECLKVLAGHDKSVMGVLFSPDGGRLISAGEEDTVRVWDSVTGAVLHVMTDLGGEIGGVEFSSDGHHLATSADDCIRVWDSSASRLLWFAEILSADASAAWTADGELLATTGDAWRYLRAACFDDDGRLLGLQPHELYFTPDDAAASRKISGSMPS